MSRFTWINKTFAFAAEDLGDEAVLVAGSNDYDSVDHSKTYDQPEVLELLKTLRDVLQNRTAEDEDNPK